LARVPHTRLTRILALAAVLGALAVPSTAVAGMAPVVDGRSPDTLDAAAATARITDGRSPDTLDATRTPQPIEVVTTGGFDWSDAGIGAGFGAGVLALVAGAALVLTSRRQHPQTPRTAS